MPRKEPVRVLGIVGSPRRGGNTEVLVDEVLAGTEEVGALTEKTILAGLDIAPCDACNACSELGCCVHEDDMHTLLDQMERSQVWVLGTPVYWWGPTAQFKTFLDRWYGVERAMFRGRRVILAIPLGGSAGYARHTEGILIDIADYLGMELEATLLAPGVHRPGAVRGNAHIMADARQAGREAVSKLLR